MVKSVGKVSTTALYCTSCVKYWKVMYNYSYNINYRYCRDNYYNTLQYIIHMVRKSNVEMFYLNTVCKEQVK